MALGFKTLTRDIPRSSLARDLCCMSGLLSPCPHFLSVLCCLLSNNSQNSSYYRDAKLNQQPCQGEIKGVQHAVFKSLQKNVFLQLFCKVNREMEKALISLFIV